MVFVAHGAAWRMIERLFARTITVVLGVLFSAGICFAEPQKMSAPEALSLSQKQSLIILDIRSPGEWDETGVADGAWPVTMHDPKFGRNLQRILKSYPDRPLALICATGGRSDHVAKLLEQNGIDGVIDISEGMLGNGDAPGWIARDFPVVEANTARRNLPKSLLE